VCVPMTDVLVKRIGSVALVQLNRPKALNALNLGMIESMYSAYQSFQREGVKLIILEGAGEKAFCAGGDVRAIWEDKTGSVGREFFVKEYRWVRFRFSSGNRKKIFFFFCFA
jgi:enoyl-CoA hydratase/carnithine racemase